MTQYLSQKSLAVLLLCAFCLGVGIGAVYSLFSIRRAAFNRLHLARIVSAIFLHLEDFLICVLGGVSLSVLYFATTGGVLRLMAVPALGVGIFAWRRTAGRLVAACTDRILHLLSVLCKWIQRRVLAPVGRAVKNAACRLHCRWVAHRNRRFYETLSRKAGKITARYGAILAEAASSGMLPPPNLRGRSSKFKKKLQKQSRNHKKERSK